MYIWGGNSTPMFVRNKKVGDYEYLQIVENRREGTKTKQRVIGTIGRTDQLRDSRELESLIRSLSNYTNKIRILLSENSQQVKAGVLKIGSALIFERLWEETGIGSIIRSLVDDRKYQFEVERAIFITVLHRLFLSGSDRNCEKWKENYVIKGSEKISLQHFYRAMAFLGEEIKDQEHATVFSPRCQKDLIEERLFARRRDLFTGLSMVFFDTTSVYFEGEGGDDIGKYGHSKDHRPDLKQMIVGLVLDTEGTPLCCEIWPGNTTDVTTLIPVANRMKKRFGVERFCVVSDRGMISNKTILELDRMDIPFILGARMRRNDEVKNEVLTRKGRFKEVHPESKNQKDPSPLEVKEVWVDDRRYIVCKNSLQARKDFADRQAIVESLQVTLKKKPKALIGNKGYRKYLKMGKGSLRIDQDKIREEAKYDGKWVLSTNTAWDANEVALQYKELWKVEQLFRNMKSILETRPVYHRADETIRGHVFCSFLALVLMKELDRRLESAKQDFEWNDIQRDLESLQEVTLVDQEKTVHIRTELKGICGKIFQAVGVAIPPTIR